MVDQQQWAIIVFIQLLIQNASSQIAIFPPPMFPIVMPPPIQVAVPVTMKTTTTTEKTDPIAVQVVPVPVPMPVQIAIPALSPPSFCQGSPRPLECPPCPPCLCTPSCTPAFFSYCSPCHQKCRCRKQTDPPIPQPLYPPQPVQGPAFPIPVSVHQPAPILMVPFPTIRRHPRSRRPRTKPREDSSDSNCESESSDSSSSSDWHRKWIRSNDRMDKKLKLKQIQRRNIKRSDFSDGELVKPVLTYISKDGNIKIKRRISSDDVAQLLDENEIDNDRKSQEFQILTGKVSKQNLLVVSNDEDEVFSNRKNIHVALRKGGSSHVLKEGKKELIFRPPVDKKITNLSLFFQVE